MAKSQGYQFLKKGLKYFSTVRKELLFLLLIAVITYVTIELVLNRYNGLFPGAHELGQLFSKLSVSYISAFIFYFVVVHTKAETDKENINEYVGHKVHVITASAHLLIQPLQQEVNPQARFEDFKLSDLHDLLKAIDRKDNHAPYVINGRRATWVEWFEYLKELTEKTIREIFIRYNHLDSELIKLLTRIEQSLFFRQWSLLYDFRDDSTFSVYEFQIRTYLNHINALEVYATKHFKSYQYMSNEFIGAE
jgi:hypothetical protein